MGRPPYFLFCVHLMDLIDKLLTVSRHSQRSDVALKGRVARGSGVLRPWRSK